MVRLSTPDDRRRLCVTAMRAFVGDPVLRWLHPDDEQYLAAGGEVFRAAMTGWQAANEVWCTDDGAALAVWIQPGRPSVEVFVDPPVAPPSPELQQRFETLGGFMADNTPPEEHWYLQLLATHPDWQRQGLGARLMAPVVERADAEGLPCYLETETAANVAYYRRHGFDVRSEVSGSTGRRPTELRARRSASSASAASTHVDRCRRCRLHSSSSSPSAARWSPIPRC